MLVRRCSRNGEGWTEDGRALTGGAGHLHEAANDRVIAGAKCLGATRDAGTRDRADMADMAAREVRESMAIVAKLGERTVKLAVCTASRLGQAGFSLDSLGVAMRE